MKKKVKAKNKNIIKNTNNLQKNKNRSNNNKNINKTNNKQKKEKVIKKETIIKEEPIKKENDIKKDDIIKDNKKSKKTKSINKKIKLKLMVIVITSVLLICGIGITYSLFTSKGNLHVDQKIAKFVFEAKKTDTIQLPITDLNPGDKTSYQFQVTNNSKDKKSEVTINYQMIIKTFHFMPLDINLYKINGDKEEFIIKCDETFSHNQENQRVCNTEISELSHKNELTEEYKLEVSFPKEYKSQEYSELVDQIEIQIKSWQKMWE